MMTRTKNKAGILTNPIMLISLALLVGSFLPILLLGGESFIQIHDNLDSEFIYLHLLKTNGMLFPTTQSIVIPQLINGLSVDFIHSEFSFIRVLFYWFPSFWAYVINSLLVRAIGVVGMVLLISHHFNHIKIPDYLVIVLAVSFALLPVYSLYGISVLGQPLLLWSFLNLKSKRLVLVSLLVCVLFPFYSHFAMTAPFILLAVLVFGLIHLFMHTRISVYYFIGWSVLCLFYLLANLLTIENFIFGGITSHRTVWSWAWKLTDFSATATVFKNTLTKGQYHASTFYGLPVLCLAVYVVLRKVSNWKTIICLLLTVLSISLFYSVYRFIAVGLEDTVHLLTSFQFYRFIFLLPFLFYLILIHCFAGYAKHKYLIIIALLVFCSRNVLYNHEFIQNTKALVKSEKRANSFNSFFSSGLFKEIKDSIGIEQDQYRVISLGFQPSIALYNGFYSLDAYLNNYPLSYKNQFREIIEGELQKDSHLQNFYDKWGSRCYLFSAELRKGCNLSCNKYNGKSINQLNINTEALKNMGAAYVLSSVLILNAKDINLTLVNSFEHESSNLKIYLYKL